MGSLGSHAAYTCNVWLSLSSMPRFFSYGGNGAASCRLVSMPRVFSYGGNGAASCRRSFSSICANKDNRSDLSLQEDVQRNTTPFGRLLRGEARPTVYHEEAEYFA